MCKGNCLKKYFLLFFKVFSNRILGWMESIKSIAVGKERHIGGINAVLQVFKWHALIHTLVKYYLFV